MVCEEGCQTSGLSETIGDKLNVLQPLPLPLLMIALCAWCLLHASWMSTD